MWPRSAGAVPGKSPAGGACRTSKERATDPATAAPAGANDPIAAIFSFIPSPALCRQPTLDAYVPIGGERPTLERARGLTIWPPIRRRAGRSTRRSVSASTATWTSSATGQIEATNYLFSLADHESVLELTFNHV
jgi:hypothetical protein